MVAVPDVMVTEKDCPPHNRGPEQSTSACGAGSIDAAMAIHNDAARDQ